MSARRFQTALFCLTLALASGAEAAGWEQACGVALAQRLAGDSPILTVGDEKILARRLLREVHAGDSPLPQWREPRRQQLLAAIADSLDDGLRVEDYPVPAAAPGPGLTPEACADAELLLDESLLRLGYSLRFGRTDPGTLSDTWNYPRRLGRREAGRWLAETVAAGALAQALADLRPEGLWYQRLRETLARLRRQAGAPAWPLLVERESLRPGMTGEAIGLLRARLENEDPPAPIPGADPTHFDEGLAAAVRTFQTRHGLQVDGVVGQQTRAALNVPRAQRLDTLRVNLERMRWISRDLPPTFLAVNIAAFQAGLVEQGRVIWRARTIVGRPYRQTPVFRSTINLLEINPTWTVPPGILKADILPAQRRDPAYLSHKGLQVLDPRGTVVDPSSIDWQHLTAANFPYVLRQPPGENNALGRIKFLFPNPYSVYLHDTPTHDLFQQTARLFSSGCIRLERPFELAEYLLRDDPQWSPARIREVLASGRQTRIRLRTPLPVLLLYLTAYTDSAGVVNWRQDVYGRDAKILRALSEPFRFSLPRDASPDADG